MSGTNLKRRSWFSAVETQFPISTPRLDPHLPNSAMICGIITASEL